MSNSHPERCSQRSYYSDSIANFLNQSSDEVFGRIAKADPFSQTLDTQRYTWQKEISILKDQLATLSEGRILFEYMIPRMGKRVDVVILHQNIVFLLEFKCGDTEYKRHAYNQVYDYALDLRNFHKESHDKILACLMISDEAETCQCRIQKVDNIIEPIPCNAKNICEAIANVCATISTPTFDYDLWECSEYLPTPTIVEAAQALYQGHSVQDITRSDAGAKNLTITTAAINKIIKKSKAQKRKSICFVTGVPGAGKTLVGLNIAIEYANADAGEHAVFLSGNQPLVTVLQEALVRDKIARDEAVGLKTTRTTAERETNAFIQIIHKYRDDFVGNTVIPPEHVVIFDEAQRAWTNKAISDFMRKKKGIGDFSYSEPEFLISTMDRHTDWAVVICLIGGGQEINTGEAGLPEWFDSLRRSFSGWDVYVTPQLKDNEYTRQREWLTLVSDLNITEDESLHLNSSVRSFRTPQLAAFVKELLDINSDTAKLLYEQIKDKYPLVLSRELSNAKHWLKSQCHGTMKYGILASSEAKRLKPENIHVKGGNQKDKKEIAYWMLNDKDDVRSCYALEDPATEFDIQGLELDYALVAWDADLRFQNGEWAYYSFKGSVWQSIHNEEKKLYLKNAYRVLLTRSRQGMVIFIPKGSADDTSRLPSFYDSLYHYLKSLGIEEV